MMSENYLGPMTKSTITNYILWKSITNYILWKSIKEDPLNYKDLYNPIKGDKSRLSEMLDAN